MEAQPLQPTLAQAQQALETALTEACGIDLKQVDTGELIRIEETLSEASAAAKAAVSVRLRLRSERVKRTEAGQAAVAPDSGDDASIGHRVFEDIRGKRWHAFAVQGSPATVERASLPDSFKHGWLVFECPDEIRRVAPIPERWDELSTDELQKLCHSAEASPRRTGQR
jgi:hypothetical protein